MSPRSPLERVARPLENADLAIIHRNAPTPRPRNVEATDACHTAQARLRAHACRLPEKLRDLVARGLSPGVLCRLLWLLAAHLMPLSFSPLTQHLGALSTSLWIWGRKEPVSREEPAP